MKQIDKLLLKSFIPPFILTFFIALFVLIMQFIWLHIDEIIGKGAGFGVVAELFFYLSISLIPLALPIGVLISSVMVMGNLAEKYELSSMISAGIPLIRIMRPLMAIAGFIAIGSFLCSNYLIPLANLQYKSRLQDIRNQKMALNLEVGVFNDDFKNYVIHIGKKDTKDNSIEDVIIYDYSQKGKEPIQILADKGKIHSSSDGKFLIMNLYNGTQIQANHQSRNETAGIHPFSRTTFKQWNKVFDLSEFDLNQTDTDRYHSHHAMQSVPQLQEGIDSLELKIERELKNLSEYSKGYATLPLGKNLNDLSPSDVIEQEPQSDSIKKEINVSPIPKERQRPITAQKITKPLAEHSSLINTFLNGKMQKKFLSKAQSNVLNLKNKAKTVSHAIGKHQNNKIKHVYELNIKFSLAIICFIFLFIGASMGAIVRKGGFGLPLLIAILFFMLYIILNVLCKKLAEGMVLQAGLAAWIPCAILLSVGLFLTFRAMNDQEFKFRGIL